MKRHLCVTKSRLKCLQAFRNDSPFDKKPAKVLTVCKNFRNIGRNVDSSKSTTGVFLFAVKKPTKYIENVVRNLKNVFGYIRCLTCGLDLQLCTTNY